jgi:hypothetical protein
VGVRVEAAKVFGEQLHQQVACAPLIACHAQLSGFENRVGVVVLRIGAWDDPLELEHRPFAARDDLLGPVLDGLVLLAPVLVVWIPVALRVEGKRHEPER